MTKYLLKSNNVYNDIRETALEGDGNTVVFNDYKLAYVFPKDGGHVKFEDGYRVSEICLDDGTIINYDKDGKPTNVDNYDGDLTAQQKREAIEKAKKFKFRVCTEIVPVAIGNLAMKENNLPPQAYQIAEVAWDQRKVAEKERERELVDAAWKRLEPGRRPVADVSGKKDVPVKVSRSLEVSVADVKAAQRP